MKRFLLASTLALAFAAVPAGSAGAGVPDCNKTGTCEEEAFVQQVLCLGNLDCPQRAARD
jgi:hypothetical protein